MHSQGQVLCLLGTCQTSSPRRHSTRIAICHVHRLHSLMSQCPAGGKATLSPRSGQVQYNLCDMQAVWWYGGGSRHT